MRIRQWSNLKYLDPEKILIGLRSIATSLPLDEFPYSVASLRTRSLRGFGEGRQCAIFCYGISQAFGLKVQFAQLESSDYDFVASFETSGLLNFVPIQMKEFVPDAVNAGTTLQEEIDKLEKYTDSRDLCVAVHLNRAGTIRLSELSIPALPIRELWFFGANSSDQVMWTLIGNLLSADSRWYEFKYPGA